MCNDLLVYFDIFRFILYCIFYLFYLPTTVYILNSCCNTCTLMLGYPVYDVGGTQSMMVGVPSLWCWGYPVYDVGVPSLWCGGTQSMWGYPVYDVGVPSLWCGGTQSMMWGYPVYDVGVPSLWGLQYILFLLQLLCSSWVYYFKHFCWYYIATCPVLPK